MNLSIGGDCIENVLRHAINVALPLSMKNIVILCGTNNIPIYSPQRIADCIISTGFISRKKSNSINTSVCGLIPCDECWLGIHKLTEWNLGVSVQYKCLYFHIPRSWMDSCQRLPQLLFVLQRFAAPTEHGNVKLAKSITLTPRYNHINRSSTNSNMSYSAILLHKMFKLFLCR